MLLGDAMAERLVRGELSALYLSVDSNDPDVYASMRVGGELRQVEEGLRRVRAWKERLGVPWPVVTINATFMERNIGQLPSMVGWARELGCAALSVQLMEMENPELEPEFLGHHPERAAAALEAALARGREVGLTIRPHAALLGLIHAAARGRDVAGLDYLAASQVIPVERKQQALARQGVRRTLARRKMNLALPASRMNACSWSVAPSPGTTC
jgi:MoaA/NifB/PqqE/SkfB family radical SAM enzyme